MPSIPLGRSAYKRTRGALPRLPVVNLLAEQAPSEEEGVVYQSRMGLLATDFIGDGPIRATIQKDGVLDATKITVSGSKVYAGTGLGVTEIGDIEIAGPVSMAYDANQILITAGADMVHWDGTTFTTVSFPDGAAVTAVTYLAGYFIAIRDGTQRFYFSAPGDATSWDGLDYAAAENKPDTLRDALVANDTLILIGLESTEFWAKTGNADLPFQAVQQRSFEIGAVDTGCSVVADNTHFCIGQDFVVYRAGNVPEPISDDGHTEDILKSSARSMFYMTDERHKLLCVRLDSKTLVFDITSSVWSEFATIGRPNWRGRCADLGVIGDDTDGVIWVQDGYLDGDAPMERRIAAGFAINGGAVQVDKVSIRCEVGQTQYLTGPYQEATVEMRYSNDGGRTFVSWEEESLGEQGDYRTNPEWRALGAFDSPGALFEFRVTDPIDVRFSGAFVNEPGGGRSR